MAVLLISQTKRFVGGSGDEKPTTGVPPGSLFHETTDGDPATSRVYVFDGTAWALQVTTIENIPE